MSELAILTWPRPACCSPDLQEDVGCICGWAERALRGWAHGYQIEPMTPEQRVFCLQEIALVEGYRVTDYEHANDADLARGVLSAWTDYCRDKGLLP